ncbi:FkbM family methyltransferase [Oscillatoria nigro-viridis]|uniref:FkbM family methyltransferase n=1 Tax=Phormidium nigroviride TaxID=482564 RepID=UPI0012373704|nr:FkbM family methyltransferase [Oscillatoria nigro-viridis]
MVEIISVHLPKTAGSTFRQILIQVYGSEQVFCDYFLDGFTEKVESRPVTHALEWISPQHRVIHGHFPVSKYKEYFPEAKWIIWLRNPILKLISYYFFQKGIPATDDSPLIRHIQETQMDIFEFAELPAIKYWSAPSIISGMKLSDFYFVGIQDFFKEDMEDLKKKLGWSEMEVSVFNENPYPKYQNLLQEMLDDSKLMNNLEHILSADMELYQEALNLREKRRGESKAASVNQHKLELSKKESSLEQIQIDLERSQSKLQQIQADVERSHLQPPQHQIKKEIEIDEYILQGQLNDQKLLTVVDDLVKQKLTDKAEGILSKILKQNSSNGEKLIEVLSGKGDWQTLWLMAQAAKKIGKINLVDKACAAVESINPQFWFAREYPNHARGYYSQCEQDKVIEKFFLDYPPKNKIFVEVGACDGVHYSNVRRLYETYGWTGLCIEPVKRNFEKLAQSYQNTSVKCIRAAVGLEEGELDINVGINPDIPEWQSDVSTFLESETLRWQEEYGMLWEKEKVSIQRLTTILDENGIPEIDFISIDTEGFDFDVLKSLDFSRFRPSMIVVEYGKDRQQIISYLAELGYSLMFDNGQDLFMVRLNHLFSEICPFLPATKAYTGGSGNPPYAEIQHTTEHYFHEFIGKSANEVGCIVIVGTHLGYEIDTFLQNYPNAEIHAFEASQRYFSLLLERFAGSRRVFCHNYAVSEENGTAVFYETTIDGTGSLLPMKIQEDQDQGLTTFGASPAEAYTVATVTLDSFAPLAGKKIDLLWCDVQGAELKVLEGAKQTLKRCSSLFLEVWLYRTMYQDQCQLSNLEKYLAEHSIYLSSIGLNQIGGGQGDGFWLKSNEIQQKEILDALNSRKKIVALIRQESYRELQLEDGGTDALSKEVRQLDSQPEETEEELKRSQSQTKQHQNPGGFEQFTTKLQQVQEELQPIKDELELRQIQYQKTQEELAHTKSQLIEALTQLREMEGAAAPLNQLAELYLVQGKLEDAISVCEQALKIRPTFAPAYKTLGNVFQAQGKLDEAKSWYIRALEIQPDFAQALANLGTIHAQQQQWQEAIASYQKAIAIQPHFAGFYRNLAKVFSQIGKPDEAVECSYAAVILEPQTTAEEYFNLGNTLLEQGKQERAIVCYRRAVYLNPSFSEAHDKLKEIMSVVGE